MIGEKDLKLKEDKNFNEASEYISGLEQLLLKKSPVTEKEIADEKFKIYCQCSNAETVTDQDKYLEKWTIYITGLMAKHGVQYE